MIDAAGASGSIERLEYASAYQYVAATSAAVPGAASSGIADGASGGPGSACAAIASARPHASATQGLLRDGVAEKIDALETRFTS